MASFDFAIAGSDPVAALIAGRLAEVHKKKVLLIADPVAGISLPRQAYLSFPLATRPETLSLVLKVAPEANRFLQKLAGRQVLSSAAPLVTVSSATARDAMAHMLHMAQYFGLEMERLNTNRSSGDAQRFRVRGVQIVRYSPLRQALPDWLDKAGIQICDVRTVSVTTHRDGAVSIVAGQDQHEAENLVLADAQALRAFGHRGDIAQDFSEGWGVAVLTEPVKTSEPVALQPEFGFQAWQQTNGCLAITAQVPATAIGDLVEQSVPSETPPRRAGQSEFPLLMPRDGGPVVGRFARSNVHVAMGFGQAGLHMGPAIARYLADQASEDEQTYFSSRAPGSGRSDGHCADFSGAPLEEMPA